MKSLKKQLKEVDEAIENLWVGIEKGQSVEMLTERINRRKAEKEELEKKLAIEETKLFTVTEPEIYSFLSHLKKGTKNDINKCRTLINIFVREIYLYDDYLTLIANSTCKELSSDDIPLSSIEEYFNSPESVSLLTHDAPPKIDKVLLNLVDFYFFTLHYSLFTKKALSIFGSNK